MIEVAGERVFFGDFHGQWLEKPENFPIFLAGLTYYGYDFSMFQGQSGHDTSLNGPLQKLIRDLEINFTVFPDGYELFFDWGHVTTAEFHPDAEMPPSTEPDFEKVFRYLKNHTRFCALAHPYPDMFDKLDRLLDNGLIDAVELVNSDGGGSNHAFLRNWYEKRLHRGRLTPIVSGLDVHTSHGYSRPPVFFNSDYSPNKDIHLLDTQRTLVLAECRDEGCVFDAVRRGRSLIEIRGRLIGPPKLVEKLVKGGYFAVRARAQEERENFKLISASGERAVALEKFALIVQDPMKKPGEAIGYRPDGGVVRTPYKPDESFIMKNVPASSDWNQSYAAIKVRTADGRGRLFTLRVRPRLAVDLQPKVTGKRGRRRIYAIRLSLQNNRPVPVRGHYILRSEAVPGGAIKGCFGPIQPEDAVALDHPLRGLNEPLRSRSFTAEVIPEVGPPQRFLKDLVFLAVPHAGILNAKAWAACDPIRLNRREQLDPAFSSDWKGPRDCSGEFRVLWNEEALHFCMEVTDDILARGSVRDPNAAMWSDAMQIGVNPLNREDVPEFSFYDIWTTRGAHRNNEHGWIRLGPNMAVDGIERGRVNIPARFFSVQRLSRTRTRVRLNLPWRFLLPMQPVSGYRFGLYMILWDNDGSGVKAALCWPRPNQGRAWYQPEGAGWAQAELL